jgi:hypothetical protein
MLKTINHIIMGHLTVKVAAGPAQQGNLLAAKP